MKRIFAALAVMSSTACFADSTVYVYKSIDGSTLLSAKEITEEGYTLESSAKYLSKNPVTNSWYLSDCGKDRFNGAKSCSINYGELFVSIYQGQTRVFIGGADFPRQQSAIKIDNNKTIYGYEGGFKNNQNIINQMLKGKMVYIQYVKFPYKYNQDREISLNGFVDAYSEMKQKYGEL